MTGRVQTLYNDRVANSIVRFDPIQDGAAHALDTVLARLMGADRKINFFGSKQNVKGLYIWGGVGRGKSMLMDMFVEELPPKYPARRVHFHAFMRETHALIHQWRQMMLKERRALPYFVKGYGDDPIPHLARRVAQSYKILAFDEFHVTQIADAMILSRLFECLFDERVIVIATSNRVPEDLYINGINRELFLPFIQILRDNCDVFDLASPHDYRLNTLSGASVWHVQDIDAATPPDMLDQWNGLRSGCPPKPEQLEVQGRMLEIPDMVGDIAWMDFASLCGQPLGASDYLALSEVVRVLFLANIPKLHPENRNEAARFVTLIDILYETKTILIASAARPPEILYQRGDGAFEFQRTVSRLVEMQGMAYLDNWDMD